MVPQQQYFAFNKVIKLKFAPNDRSAQEQLSNKSKMKYQISEFINFLKLKFLLVLIYQNSKERNENGFYILLRPTSNEVRVIVPLVGDPENLPDVLGEIVDSPRLDWTFFYQYGEAWGSMLLGDRSLALCLW